MEETKIDQLQQKEDQRLKIAVLDAYRKREKRDLTIRLSSEDVRKSEVVKGLLAQNNSEDVLDFREDFGENCVLVSDPHVYKRLLELSYRLILGVNEEAMKATEAHLAHELDHAAPLTGNNNVSVTYGVSFFEDVNDPQLRAVRPFVRVTGNLTIGDYVESIGNPTNLSAGDEAILSDL